MNGNGSGSPSWKWVAGVLLGGLLALLSARIDGDEDRLEALESRHQIAEIRWATIEEELKHIRADLAEVKALVRANAPTVLSTTGRERGFGR